MDSPVGISLGSEVGGDALGEYDGMPVGEVVLGADAGLGGEKRAMHFSGTQRHSMSVSHVASVSRSTHGRKVSPDNVVVLVVFFSEN